MPTDIAANIASLQRRIALACQRASRSPNDITLVAITKNVPAAMVRLAFEAGLRHFGENRVQEAESKLEQLTDIRKETTWHMVGHLQTNKARRALEIFDIIQSVDSLHLAEVLDRRATRRVPVLLEVNVSGETTKSGFRPDEMADVTRSISSFRKLEILGLMTIAPVVKQPEEARPYFRQLRELRDRLGLKEISMGMSDDFEIAIEEGATIIRIGRAIFGERN